MKKVLIWDNFQLEDRGGQFGYLYQIHEYLKTHPNNNIVFLSDLISQYKIISPNSPENDTDTRSQSFDYGKFDFRSLGLFRKIKSITKSILFPILYSDNSIITKIKLGVNFGYKQFRNGLNEIPQQIQINDYDFIHFHFNPTASQFMTSFPQYKGGIILTSHCPCSWTDEHLNYYPSWMKYFRFMALWSECRTYKKVDYLMFPCLEAREAYEKVPQIRRIFKKCESKFFYVPTAILDKNINKHNIQHIDSLGIPSGMFVISFFGRHISIKGYDVLKKIGRDLLEKYDNLYFLCAGKGPIEPLNHVRWIELGFIKNTYELLPQTDLYILPNRDTYFDIIAIEVLRAGTRLLMSLTGGNKYFHRLPKTETIGIEFFNIDNYESLLCLVEQAIKEKNENPIKYSQLGECNRKLYEQRFTMSQYVSTYINAIEKL